MGGENSSRPTWRILPRLFKTNRYMRPYIEWQCWTTDVCSVKSWIPLGGRARKWTAGLRTANATCSHWRFRLVPSKQSKYFQRNNVIRKKTWVEFSFFLNNLSSVQLPRHLNDAPKKPRFFTWTRKSSWYFFTHLQELGASTWAAGLLGPCLECARALAR